MFDKKTGNYRTISFNYIASLPRLLLGSYEPIKTKSDLDFLSKSPCVETQFKLPDNFLQEYLTFIEFMDNIPMNM